MFSIFNFSPKAKKDFSGLGTDMHSHLLPGIDDGAACPEDSLRMMVGLQELGFHTLYTTPHSIKDIHPNTKESLCESHMRVNHMVPKGVTLDYSSEYFLDEYFLQNLQDGRLRPLPGNRLLIEFSMVSTPLDLEQQFFNVQMEGFQIILAHPERYLFFQKSSALLSRLKDMDVEFQVNALSLGGYYGETAKSAAEKMIKNGWIDFVGTDAHLDKHISALRKIPDTHAYQRLLDQGNLKNSTLTEQR